jgi:dihydrofolate reductase
MMTLDGFFEGPDRDINWHRVDEEFNDFAIEQLNSGDMLVFGRVTYQLMASYWPTPQALADDPIVASHMNNLPKIAASRTLDKVEWNNTRLVTENVSEEIARLKAQPGKDLFLLGSADLASTLIRDGLIDEFRVMLNPVLLGAGTPLFQGIGEPMELELLRSRPFRNGNILLYYVPVKR